jgi:hypothetical protein
MLLNNPVHLLFGDYFSKAEVQKAKVIHVRDDYEELVSFKPQKFSLSAELCWLKDYQVAEARFDTETEELFIRIV